MTTRDSAPEEHDAMLDLLKAEIAGTPVTWTPALERDIWRQVMASAAPPTPIRERSTWTKLLTSAATVAIVLGSIVGGAWWNGESNRNGFHATATEWSAPTTTPTIAATPIASPQSDEPAPG